MFSLSAISSRVRCTVRRGIIVALAAASFGLLQSAYATCYQVNNTTGNQPDNYTIQPSDGVVVYWYPGARGDSGGSLGLSGVVNVSSDTNFQPIGTVLTSSTALFPQWGKSGGYNPEQILFRCAPGDAGSLYELYATHGNDRYAESFPVAAVPNAYYTAWTNIGIRIKNLNPGGGYFTRYWQQRALTGLDVDTKGYLLVKAKNFAQVQVELIRVDNGAGATGGKWTSVPQTNNSAGSSFPSNLALGYLGFAGPGLNGPTPGADSYSGGANQWGYNEGTWPGFLGLSGISVRRSSTCALTNATPLVQFPSITVGELNSNGSRTANFSIQFNCQSGAIVSNTYADTSSGTGTCGWGTPNTSSCTTSSATALGFLPSTGAVAAAQALSGLNTSSTGLTYLLSDQYPVGGVSNGIARGVGIQIYRQSTPGTAMNLLSVDNSAGNTSKTSDAVANAAGWYRLVDPASTSNLGNGNYSETFTATLKKLPAGTGEPVTAGRVYSTARVLIRVQ